MQSIQRKFSQIESQGIKQRFTALTFGFLLCLLPPPSYGQETPSEREGIRSAEPSKVIYVRTSIRSTTRPLFVASCGGSRQYGHYSLCQGAAFLEVRRGGRWERAKPPKGMLARLGTDINSDRKWITVESSSSERFVFAFTPDLLGVSTGDRLRVAVDAWTGPKEPKQDDPHLTFYSPEFVCP